MYYSFIEVDGVMNPKGGFQKKKLPIQSTEAEVVLSWWPEHRNVEISFDINDEGHRRLIMKIRKES